MTNSIDMEKVAFIALDKTDDEKVEEKERYNSFLNFMTDIIVKYGLNEDQQSA